MKSPLIITKRKMRCTIAGDEESYPPCTLSLTKNQSQLLPASIIPINNEFQIILNQNHFAKLWIWSDSPTHTHTRTLKRSRITQIRIPIEKNIAVDREPDKWCRICRTWSEWWCWSFPRIDLRGIRACTLLMVSPPPFQIWVSRFQGPWGLMWC